MYKYNEIQYNKFTKFWGNSGHVRRVMTNDSL